MVRAIVLLGLLSCVMCGGMTDVHTRRQRNLNSGSAASVDRRGDRAVVAANASTSHSAGCRQDRSNGERKEGGGS